MAPKRDKKRKKQEDSQNDLDLIEAFDKNNAKRLERPLKVWNRVDSCVDIAAGQDWYELEGSTKQQSSDHAPITSSLRSMGQLNASQALQIPPEMHNVTFPQAHTVFASWFVMDVVNDRLDIFSLPNMKSLTAVRAGINEFAEERWPQNGRHALREVHLRAWVKLPFRAAMQEEYSKSLLHKFDSYLEPLTKKNIPYNRSRGDVIEHTINLWSYLSPLGGMLDLIQPKLGSFFSPELHEGFDENGVQYIAEKGSKKRILWITRRGFQYREERPEGPREMIVKALVIVR
ncbi:hypothetical protein LSUE1_G001551 [Lachnellula suecica]|uniref:Uncharacterized protein n=1 Tax=Lachnellula suecica TaxID=602035 RepID=A0A8T9CC09_9HELO|nr:hypothetical protein LSUE1_G001551 [Lachnellula suecica]